MNIKTQTVTALAVGVLAVGALSAQESTRPEVGQEAGDFSLESSTGETFDLASQRGEKNVLLVFFRGTW